MCRTGDEVMMDAEIESVAEPTENPAELELRWLQVAAVEKAGSVIALAQHATDVVEIGCGTGALLEELHRRGFGKRFWACEPSRELWERIPALERLVSAEPTTFDCAFGGRRFDLAIISHVAEHVLAPSALVAQALDRADRILVEVPIEANVLGKLRGALTGRESARNQAGHLHFFSRRSARFMVEYAGGKVLSERGYFPYAPYRAQADRCYQKVVLSAARFERMGRLWYEHFAMLATRVSIDHWDHVFATPELGASE
jgi:SAM-dependent methyltransferase